jgi:hypothetical protein
MELRLLANQAERTIFARRLTEARVTKGAGFSETKRSVVGSVHLTYGNLYGLYDEAGPNPDEMLSGFAFHDLGSFPQSYPRPDLTHLVPERVLECGELWALAAGGARLARHAGWILAGILGAEALLVYPIVKPWNLSFMYKRFDRVCDPIAWPYARTLDGGNIFVQPMVLEGAALERTVQEAQAFGYEADGDARIRFNSPFPMCKGPQANRDGRVWREAPAAQPVQSAA